MARSLDYGSFGRRVRTRRKQLKITQVELGALIDVSPSYIGHLERGLRAPSTEVLVDLCNALKVSPEYLLKDYLDGEDKTPAVPIDRNDLASMLKVAQYLRDTVVDYDDK